MTIERTVQFEPDGEEGTYGNVVIICPCCSSEWEENAEHVGSEVAKALSESAWGRTWARIKESLAKGEKAKTQHALETPSEDTEPEHQTLSGSERGPSSEGDEA